MAKGEWTDIDIKMACIYFFVHVPCIFAPFHFNWGAFFVAFALYFITGLFGLSISYHRNLSHKSFKLPKWFEYLLAYCGLHALQGDPIDWVSTHRYHHQFVDTERDPDSPTQGLLFSYITWAFDSYALTKKVCPKYFSDFEEEERGIFVMARKHGRPNNVGDLEKQAFYRFIHKTYLLHVIALAVILYVVGGIPFLIWGTFVRTVMLLHSTFMVSSICHKWGHQQWGNTGLSKNNWWMTFISFGENWHNNHHAFEYSARIGFEWWQIDFGWYIILFLKTIGVATDVKLPRMSLTIEAFNIHPKTNISLIEK
ncbi:palmitoyl-monogalactosyldiacylglycerol delta-7 desaturase, chloroplastic-like [Momordica charantia]|uniref:Palmitoyl-monogalactosyldiacylglycerol delta-7 desaturase, chloroplastic-like n=1 Tax=Momordica charantia TaxID=3673 RepID=A0A6J1CTB0_MOMCH|nr:palmitoyl-monogalactosyldiacylglycerol delta-7 desaturase, chloroplastic-like [Momordica charantia]